MAKNITIVDNLQFDSKLEATAYSLFKANNVTIKSMHPEFILFNEFEYTDIDNKTHKIRNMKYSGDFEIVSDKYNKPIIVEIKGFPTEAYMMRKKLFLMKYSDQYYFIQLNSPKDVKEFIEKL